MELMLISLLLFVSLILFYLVRPSGSYQMARRLHRLGGRTGPEVTTQHLIFFYSLLLAASVSRHIGWNSIVFLCLLYVLSQITPRVLGRERKARASEEQIEHLCMSLINSLEAGMSLLQALEYSTEHLEGPLGEDLRKAMNHHHAGVSLMSSLQSCAEGMKSPLFQYLVDVLAIHQESGGQLSVVLALTAATIRERRVAGQELMSRTIEARLSACILAFLPLLIGLVLLLWQPDSLRPLLVEPAGRNGLGLAAVCWATGIAVANGLVRSISKEVGL